MKKKTILYVAGAALAVYLLTLVYRKNKQDEPVPVDDQKELLITQLLVKNQEPDTPENRAKYQKLSAEELKKMLETPVDVPPSGPEGPTDTLGLVLDK